MYLSLVMRLREGLLHRARGGHDHLTSITLPAGYTIKPPDAGSRQCPWVTALLKEQVASSTPSGSWPKLTPTGQHAWPDTNRSSGALLERLRPHRQQPISDSEPQPSDPWIPVWAGPSCIPRVDLAKRFKIHPAYMP
jgi:hypothetical protein